MTADRAALLRAGFAVGDYILVCIDCKLKFQGDKRSYRCRPCAEAALQTHGQDAKPSEETTRAALVEKVKRSFIAAVLGHMTDSEAAAAAIDLIRAEVLEEAATAAMGPQLKDGWRGTNEYAWAEKGDYGEGRADAAAEIRALKEKANNGLTQPTA